MKTSHFKQEPLFDLKHDIRSRLYSAKSHLEALVVSLKQRQGTEMSLSTAEIVLRQISDVLLAVRKLNQLANHSDLSQEANKRTLVQAVLRRLLRIGAVILELEGIKVVNHLDSKTPAVRMSPVDLEEILFNLIANACAAMKVGGTLGFSSAFDEQLVTLKVSDTGEGIPKKQLKSIFEPFHTTKGNAGSGLGLYIVKRLVEQNGGRVLVASVPQKGTAFTLLLPKK